MFHYGHTWQAISKSKHNEDMWKDLTTHFGVSQQPHSARWTPYASAGRCTSRSQSNATSHWFLLQEITFLNRYVPMFPIYFVAPILFISFVPKQTTMSLHAFRVVLIQTGLLNPPPGQACIAGLELHLHLGILFYLKQTPLPSLTMTLVYLFFSSTLTQDNTTTHNHCTREYGSIHTQSKRKLLPPATFMCTFCPLNVPQQV